MTGGLRASLSTSKPVTATAAGLFLYLADQAQKAGPHGTTPPASGMDARQGEDLFGLPLCRQPGPQRDATLQSLVIQNLQL